MLSYTLLVIHQPFTLELHRSLDKGHNPIIFCWHAQMFSHNLIPPGPTLKGAEGSNRANCSPHVTRCADHMLISYGWHMYNRRMIYLQARMYHYKSEHHFNGRNKTAVPLWEVFNGSCIDEKKAKWPIPYDFLKLFHSSTPLLCKMVLNPNI